MVAAVYILSSCRLCYTDSGSTPAARPADSGSTPAARPADSGSTPAARPAGPAMTDPQAAAAATSVIHSLVVVSAVQERSTAAGML